MACSWTSIGPTGTWVLLIPVVEEHGPGTYDVETRNGASEEVLVVRVNTSQTRRRGFDGALCYLGVTDRQQQDRAARVHRLNHLPDDPHRVRLSKRRETVILPESVAEQHLAETRPVEVDGLRVWLSDRDWKAWPVDGVRMVRVPIEAARVSA